VLSSWPDSVKVRASRRSTPPSGRSWGLLSTALTSPWGLEALCQPRAQRLAGSRCLVKLAQELRPMVRLTMAGHSTTTPTVDVSGRFAHPARRKPTHHSAFEPEAASSRSFGVERCEESARTPRTKPVERTEYRPANRVHSPQVRVGVRTPTRARLRRLTPTAGVAGPRAMLAQYPSPSGLIHKQWLARRGRSGPNARSRPVLTGPSADGRKVGRDPVKPIADLSGLITGGRWSARVWDSVVNQASCPVVQASCSPLQAEVCYGCWFPRFGL
jgi:hypothetical protein